MAADPNALVHFYTASGDPSTWLYRIVYLSGDSTVSLHTTPASQMPIGVVQQVIVNDTDYRVGVCIDGECWVKVGEAGFNATDDLFITGDDDSAGAAEDGKAAPAVAGDFYVGRGLARVDIVEDGVMRCHVAPGQLSISGS